MSGHFQLFLATKSDIFSEMSGHFQLHLWKQNRKFVMRSQEIFGHFPVMLVATKQGIFDETSEHFLVRCGDIYQPCFGDKIKLF